MTEIDKAKIDDFLVQVARSGAGTMVQLCCRHDIGVFTLWLGARRAPERKSPFEMAAGDLPLTVDAAALTDYRAFLAERYTPLRAATMMETLRVFLDYTEKTAGGGRQTSTGA